MMSEEVSSEERPEGSSDAGTELEELPDDIVERLAAHDEALAGVASGLLERVETLETELAAARDEADELTGRLKRARADFENYKRRMEEQREELEARATANLLERLVDIRTDLGRAIETEEQDVEAFREGVRMILHNLDRILDAEDVEEIDPEPGDEIDPHRHEVMMRVESDRPEGSIVEVFEPGYAQAGRVLTAAKVTVSDGSGDADAEEE